MTLHRDHWGQEAGEVWADPLIRYEGDQGVLLILTGGAGTLLHKVEQAFSVTARRRRAVAVDQSTCHASICFVK